MKEQTDRMIAVIKSLLIIAKEDRGFSSEKSLFDLSKQIKDLEFIEVKPNQDLPFVNEKKVIIMDDVISTGVTIRMMKKLMEKVEARVVKLIAVFKQGQQFDEIENLFYLTELPIFKDNCTTNSHLS